MWWEIFRGRRRRDEGDRGDGYVEYLAVVLLVAAIAATLTTLMVPDQVADNTKLAVCRILQLGGQVDSCDQTAPGTGAVPIRPGPTGSSPGPTEPNPSPGPSAPHPSFSPSPSGSPAPSPSPAQPSDPNEPTQACMVGYHSYFVQNAATGQFRLADVTSDSGGFLVLRHYVQGQGRPDLWEVVDNTWADVDVGTPSRLQKDVSAGIWGGPVGTSSTVYHFDSEQEAKNFYDTMEKHRLGNPVKVAIRTNPITSGASWLIGKIPWVGKKYDKWIGGSEPDKKPYAHSLEGGLIFGFYNDVPLLGKTVGVVGKGWDWTFVGRQWNNETGEKTTWFRTAGRAMESVQVDIGPAWKYAPGGLKNWTSGGATKAIEAIEKLLGAQAGTPVTLPASVKAAIRLSPYAGLGVMGQAGTQYALTTDKNGKAESLAQTNNVSLTFNLRVAAKSGPVGGWIHQPVVGTRWITNKTLDLTNPADSKAANEFYSKGVHDPLGARSDLNDYFDQGGGTMAKVTYDSDEPIKHLSIGVPFVAFDLEGDTEDAKAQKAEYFVPGKGWVKWNKCGLG